MLEINVSQLEQLQEFAESGVKEEVKGQRYPALQVNQYDNLQPKTKLSLCFSKDSWGLIPDHLKVKLDAIMEDTTYGQSEVEIYKINYVRFIPLAIPRVFKENKEAKTISLLSKFGDKERSIAKLFMAVMVKDEVLTQEDGSPLVVTLKLRSYPTSEVIGKDSDPGTLRNLSLELSKKKIGMPGKSNIHFVNLEIIPTSKMRSNKGDGSGRRAVAYELQSARLNTRENMAVITRAFENKELLEAIADPFRINATGEVSGNNAREIVLADIDRLIESLNLSQSQVSSLLIQRFGVNRLDRLTLEDLLEATDLIGSQRRSESLDAIPF